MKISTSPTSQNIAKILEMLTKMPDELTKLADGLSSDEIYQPLGQGEWSFQYVLIHLHHCTDVSSVRIFYALMLDNPTIPVVHPERDWGNLSPYSTFSPEDLLNSYQLKRQTLLPLLINLDENRWQRPFLKGEPRHNLHNVYREARGIALHEHTHLSDLTANLAKYL